jgi:molecular chaperone GrpE
MLDRNALTHQLLDYLETVPELPEYLAEVPDDKTAFDPYQMVGEWIALRQEVKQQNKLMQSTQQTLQQVLAQAQNQAQSPISSTSKQNDESGLIKDLLIVMDALDSAIEHGEEQIRTTPPTPQQTPQQNPENETKTGFWNQVLAFFETEDPESSTPTDATQTNLIEVLTSQKEGIEMIRRSLLDVLQKRQVKPMNALGQPFDAQCMYAIAQQPSASNPPNTVLQEVVRGYWKGDRILREAQVIVARKQE